MSIYREHIIKRFTRSSMWSKVRKAFISVNSVCEVCGKKKGLEVHHKLPFHLYPELELDSGNLATLCRKHHLTIGHLEYWKSYNPQLEGTVIYFKALLRGRP